MAKLFKSRSLASLLLKLTVILSALIGTWMSAGAGRSSFMGGSRVFMYFTIQSNLALALLSAVGAALQLAGRRPGRWWFVLRFVGAVSITLTGMVFCFVLAPTLGKFAWSTQNVLTHVVVPIAAVADFLLVCADRGLRRRDCFFVIIPPLLYACYAAIGFVCNWQFSESANYPYFFLNWGGPLGAFGVSAAFPFMGCVWWILLLLLFLLAVGRLYLLALSVMEKHAHAEE